MMFDRLRRHLIIQATIIFVAGSATGQETEKILDKLQKKYDSIHDASVAFTQKVEFGVMKSVQTFSGKFIMKKGNKFRVETEDQTIVTDGKSVWTYTRASNQVMIDTYKEDPKSFSPDKVLTNIPKNYTATALGTEKVGEEKTSILKLIPKDKKANLKWMKIWVDNDEWLMRKLQLLDVSDNLTTYLISDIKLNEGVTDAQVQFVPPDSVEVIDLR